MPDSVHITLPCGIELAVLPLPQRHVVSFQFRILAGMTSEPSDKLGLAQLIEETITKGTARRSGRELSDEFDAIGAGCSSGTGRETTTYTCTLLPEHFDRAVELHAEFFRTATFSQDAIEVNVRLAKQELDALEDDAHGLANKLLDCRAWGPMLGRHPLGENETLDRITREDIVEHWRNHYHAGRILVAVAGKVDPQHAADLLQRHFDGYGSSDTTGRVTFDREFKPGRTHQHKELQQQQIGIGWPSVDAAHDDFPIQQVVLGVLSGGMGARLFTEVREKLGLVYWVSAWQETPRGSGMLFLGASTTPDRCEQTYNTLLREVDRLAQDLAEEELDRAITGIVAGQETKGDSTAAHCAELGNDLFFYGRPVPSEEKIAKIEAVTVKDIERYLDTYPRDNLCVVTLGPKPMFTDGNGMTNE